MKLFDLLEEQKRKKEALNPNPIQVFLKAKQEVYTDGFPPIMKKLFDFFEEVIGNPENLKVHNRERLVKSNFYHHLFTSYPELQALSKQKINKQLGKYCDIIGIKVDRGCVTRVGEANNIVVRAFEFSSGLTTLKDTF